MRTIVFSKNKAMQQMSNVPDDAYVDVEELKKSQTLLLMSKTGTVLTMIREVESFTDFDIKIEKLKKEDWIDG